MISRPSSNIGHAGSKTSPSKKILALLFSFPKMFSFLYQTKLFSTLSSILISFALDNIWKQCHKRRYCLMLMTFDTFAEAILWTHYGEILQTFQLWIKITLPSFPRLQILLRFCQSEQPQQFHIRYTMYKELVFAHI